MFVLNPYNSSLLYFDDRYYLWRGTGTTDGRKFIICVDLRPEAISQLSQLSQGGMSFKFCRLKYDSELVCTRFGAHSYCILVEGLPRITQYLEEKNFSLRMTDGIHVTEFWCQIEYMYTLWQNPLRDIYWLNSGTTCYLQGMARHVRRQGWN